MSTASEREAPLPVLLGPYARTRRHHLRLDEFPYGPRPFLSRSESQIGLKLVTLFLALAFSLGIAEIAARVASRTDAYGQVELFDSPLPPIKPPLARIAELLERIERRGGQTTFQYDPDLGWSPRPGATSDDGLFRINSQGIRVDDPARVFSPDPEGPRVLLLGDSFTFGDDVSYADSWAGVLDELLPDTEVVNLGVNAYGIDQALLRWRKLGRTLNPDLVLFGLQTENAYRNLNLVRHLYSRNSGFPFTKPRFVRGKGGALELVNVPALPPERLESMLIDVYDWELAPYERFLPQRDPPGAWARSRLLGYVWSVSNTDRIRNRTHPEVVREEAIALSEGLVDLFAAEVEATGARFAVVHLPSKRTMERVLATGSFEERRLVDRIATQHLLIDAASPLIELAEADGIDAVFAGHYTPTGYRIVAETIAERLPPLPSRPGS